MSGREYIIRDTNGNEYRGSSVTKALQKMPEAARAAIPNPTVPAALNAPLEDAPQTVEDLWKNTEDAKPNLTRVYHA